MDATAGPPVPPTVDILRHRAYTVPLDRAHLLGAGVVSVLAFVLVYLVEVCTAPGQRQDAVVFARFQAVPFATSAGAVRDVVPLFLAAACVLLGAVALWRRRFRAVGAQLVVVFLAVNLSELLKVKLPRPYHGTFAYVHNTFPSSHMATTTALACAAVALWGTARWRAEATFVVVLLTLVAAVYNVTGFAHRPSDVVGGVLVATALEGFTLAALALGIRRGPGVARGAHRV